MRKTVHSLTHAFELSHVNHFLMLISTDTDWRKVIHPSTLRNSPSSTLNKLNLQHIAHHWR